MQELQKLFRERSAVNNYLFEQLPKVPSCLPADLIAFYGGTDVDLSLYSTEAMSVTHYAKLISVSHFTSIY